MAQALELEELIRRESPRIAKAVSQAAADASNEAEFRRPVANLIEEFAGPLDVSFRVQEERTLIAGRADAVYNRFVIEYEPPRSLHGSNGYRNNQHAIGQVKQYIDELHKIERHRVERMAGVATDGSWYIFARYKNESWTVDDPLPVTPESTATFLRYLASLSTEVALTADHLVRDFGENTTVSRLCVSTFYQVLGSTDHPKVKVIYDQWRQQFAEVCGYDESRSRVDLRRLARNYGISESSPNAFRLFFAVHTYYATFIKLLALQVAHFYLAPKLGTGLQQVASYSSDQLLDYLRKMERGGIFRELGINNFLEGDFFGWYLDVWDDALDRAVRRAVSELGNYSLVTLDVDPEQTRDLLKKLYQNVMPKQVRHNLGQYYTPDWLAERLLNQLGYEGDPEKRLLDPACGSGTFLVLAIQRVKQTSAEKTMREADVLEKVLANIVGFDLDPLAVMSARTNYLLALGELIQHRRGEVNIPVYLADSILTPAQMEELAGDQFRLMGPEERRYRFKTVVGEFAVPGSLVTAQYVDQLAALLEESVELKRSAEEFRTRVLAMFPLVEDSDKEDLDLLQELHGRLRDLDEAGVNGIWARIIKNAFAPLFVGRFDYVAGNPPWVNWAHLPAEYRQTLAPLWESYGLFPHRGLRARLGAAMDDISILMLYVAADRYLVRNGRLGFVITQSIFKSEGGGAGFRRLQLGERERLRVLSVDDMVELQPFEGASNRTSVAIFQKGVPTRFPVSWTYWKKAGKGYSIGTDDALEHVRELTVRANWRAEPIDPSAPASPWLTAKPKAIGGMRKCLGSSPYQARLGVHCHGNGAFWMNPLEWRTDGLAVVQNIVEAGRSALETVQTAMESDLLYPLLRGKDVAQWMSSHEVLILLPYDEEHGSKAIPVKEMRSRFPKTLRYFDRFRDFLENRSGYRQFFDPERDPFYSMYNVGEYTFAPCKLVWRYVASEFTCAVVSQAEIRPGLTRIVIPETKLVFVPLDSELEAHYLCACLSASPVRLIVASYAVNVQISTHVLNYVAVPAFDHGAALHGELARLSQQAHEATAADDSEKVEQIEEQIDRLAAQLWGLSGVELREIQQSLVELRG